MRCLTRLSQSLSMRVSGGSRSIANSGLTHGISWPDQQSLPIAAQAE